MSQAKPRAIANEDDLIPIFERSPILTSLHAGWNGIFLGHFRTPAYEAPEVCSLFWHSLLIFPKTEAPVQAQRTLDGKIQHEQVVEGDIVITPAQVSHHSCWNAGIEEHVHLLTGIPPTLSVSELIKNIKGSSSHLINHKINPHEFFKWQGSYGAFTVSHNDIGTVANYVRNQAFHHRNKSIFSDWELPSG